MKKDKILIAGAVIAVLILCVFIVQSAQNKAITYENEIEAAMADIRVQEKARVDHVQNLADCAMQYDKHESEVIHDIVEGRGNGGNNIENASTAISALTENYPELQSSAQYQTLMNDLTQTENLIAQYRNNYTSQVRDYNTYCKKFPTRIFLSLCGYEKQNYEQLDYGAPVDAPQNLFGDK